MANTLALWTRGYLYDLGTSTVNDMTLTQEVVVIEVYDR